MKGNQLTRRNFIRTTALALPLGAAGCRSVPTPTANTGDFVTIRNRRFERRGKPYCFIGANFYQVAMLADPDLPGGRERLARELDQLRSIGVTNLRVMAGSEGSLTADDGRRGMLIRPGEWDEGWLRGLDFALAEMAKRDLTGVLYLTNYERMFHCVLDSCKTGGALQGANFWVWSGEGSLHAHRQRAGGGKLSREPVDDNGVLHTDRTTLAVIRQHNAELADLVN